MKENNFHTAVLFLTFNRPEETFLVFDRIAEVKPDKLYIASDGARKNVSSEFETIENLRERLLKRINWKCEVKTLFRDENLGCKHAVSGAIDWFFENEEQGIILEDDCLPDSGFFNFCHEMLEKYKDKHEVMLITGSNVLHKWKSEYSYLFSKYGSVWGWATWKHAWQKYDLQMSGWVDSNVKQTINEYINNKSDFNQRSKIFNTVYKNKMDTWAYQLNYTILKNKALCIVPTINLVKNIGFGKAATHTNDSKHSLAFLQSNKMTFPLKHPPKVSLSNEFDEAYLKRFKKEKNLLLRILRHLSIRKNKLMIKLYSKNWDKIEYFDEDWKERIELMSSFVTPNKIVTDLGCGKMWLREYISGQNTYIPVDYKSRGKDTVICDFNKNEFPTHKSEIAFVSGCLEYIDNPALFIKNIAENNEICIVSYCTIDNFKDIKVRRANAWKNNLSRKELIQLFTDEKMELTNEAFTKSKNNVFKFIK